MSLKKSAMLMAALFSASWTADADTKTVCCLNETLHSASVRTRIVFDSENKLAGIVEDWAFDEFYSKDAISALEQKGAIASREMFAEVAKLNAVALAEVGYNTTVSVSSRPLELGELKEYWMEERPDHAVVWHMRISFRKPERLHGTAQLRVVDGNNQFEFYPEISPSAVKLVNAPKGCHASPMKGKNSSAAAVNSQIYLVAITCP